MSSLAISQSLFISLATVLLSSPITAKATTVRDLHNDAAANIFYGDFFKAYRDFNFLEEAKPLQFGKLGLEGYLQTIFVISSEKFQIAECERFGGSPDHEIKQKSSYLCGLHFVENKKVDRAEKFLSALGQDSKLYWPAQILRATAKIVSNAPLKATLLLKNEHIESFAKLGLVDEFHLTRARAFTAAAQYEDALKEYQIIGGESPFYIESLEETAWIFFKRRRLESAQVLLDVIIGHYESAQRLGNEQKVTTNAYYRARYLKAYMSLIEQRAEGAASEFADLKDEYEITLDELRQSLNSTEPLELIKNENQKWTDIKNFPDKLAAQMDLISEWLGADNKKSIESDIFFQMALRREIDRIKNNPGVTEKDNPAYLKTLETLQEKTWGIFASQYKFTMKKVERELNTLKVKAELGKMEIVWRKRAEGARSLDEVVDSYRQEAKAVDEFMGQ